MLARIDSLPGPLGGANASCLLAPNFNPAGGRPNLRRFMFHSSRGFALILVIFVIACSHIAAQEQSAEKPHVVPAPLKNAAPEESELKQGPSATQIPGGASSGLSSEPANKVEPPARAEIVSTDPKGLMAITRAKTADVPSDPEAFGKADLAQMRKAWALGVGFGQRINPESTPVPAPADDDDPANPPESEKFHWKPAIYQSLAAQGFQHAYALIFQEKTQRALKGKFFSDYWESVKGVRGWSDGNKFFTNYIAHPMQGSFTGFIFVQNHDRAKRQVFNESRQYWKDRLKALAWSAAWSTNWEIGPVSQSSIGNVGLYGHQGFVDMVITPTVGTAWMLAEEALDRYIIRHQDGKSLTRRIVFRTFLNPTRSVANVFRFKVPWHRDRD